MAETKTSLTDDQLKGIIGRNLAGVRKREGYTLAELAEAAQVAERSYFNWEAGLVLPRLDSLNRVARFYNVPIVDFLTKGKA